MTVIAVAGGTGGVGKTLVERLAREPQIKLVILSRSVSLIHIVAHLTLLISRQLSRNLTVGMAGVLAEIHVRGQRSTCTD